MSSQTRDQRSTFPLPALTAVSVSSSSLASNGQQLSTHLVNESAAVPEAAVFTEVYQDLVRGEQVASVLEDKLRQLDTRMKDIYEKMGLHWAAIDATADYSDEEPDVERETGPATGTAVVNGVDHRNGGTISGDPRDESKHASADEGQGRGSLGSGSGPTAASREVSARVEPAGPAAAVPSFRPEELALLEQMDAYARTMDGLVRANGPTSARRAAELTTAEQREQQRRQREQRRNGEVNRA